MITLQNNLAYVREARVHRFATCIKVVRLDGVTLRFTDHNTKIVLSDGTYNPVGSVASTALRKSDSFRGQDIEYVGALSSTLITADDLRKGKYRRASVYEYLVDWKYPWVGVLRTNRFFIGDVRYNGEFWEASLSSYSTLLDQPIGRLLTRNCTFDLGDARCKKDLSSFRNNGLAVLAVVTQRLVFTINDAVFAGRTLNWHRYGLIEWKTGVNAGTTSECAKSTVPSSNTITFTLFQKTALDISAGDTLDLFAGCDKLAGTCKTKFNNLVNFGGFHLIPGADAAYEVPDASIATETGS